jgi:ribonucleoside-diphosphate reductase beta chain
MTNTEIKKLYEPIIHDKERVNFYPIKEKNIMDFYNLHRSSFWTEQEIDMTDDVKDWNSLSNDERYYIEMVLSFFASSDFIVNQHLHNNFISRITLPELQIYYRFQAMMEDIHSLTYSNMINALVSDENRKSELFSAVVNIPVVSKKADWARKYILETDDEVDDFINRLIAFSVVEGVFFSGSFCAIFWLKKRGIMNGLTNSNELISRDEGLHRDVACYIYKNMIVNKKTKKQVIDIVKDGVEIEKEFVTESLPVDLIGMNSKLMCKYIEYVADHLLYNLIGEKYYNTENPFEWMNLISMEEKTNFFEIRPTAYSRADYDDISFDADI